MNGSAPGGALKADVLIVGGGMVGATLAVALAEIPMDVIVLDRQHPAAALDAGFDGRASAIALASRRLFDGLGLWAGMEGDAAPIRHIRVSEGSSPLFLHYDHRESGDGPFGYMVENRMIRDALARRLGGLHRVRVLAPAGIASVEREVAGVRVRLADGRRIGASLVVGADGRNSQTREAAGIAVTRWSYPQTGIVCTVAHERPHNAVAHERFLPAGPFAILPLAGNRSSIVWTEDADLARAIMALDDEGFLGELAGRFGDFLGGLEVVGPRWSHPLSLSFARTTIGRRLALVGDAAHGMHPIAGQGLNMGLRDVAALSEVLADARRLGLDPGDGAALEDYQRWRRFDNTLMLAATDGLNRLFSTRFRPLRLVRDLGLAAVNRLLPLKKVFMANAMGLAGDLPRLMRGEPL